MNEERSPQREQRAADAQVGVLGSMLIDERTVPILMQQLKAEDFPDSLYRHIFEGIRDVFLAGTPVDPVTVLERLGKSYGQTVRELMDLTPTAANCELYARMLKEDRLMAQIQTACREAAYAETFEQAYKALLAAAGLLLDGSSSRKANYGELISSYVLRQKDPAPPDYLDFGIPEVNAKVHISPGRFIVLGADSSVGKTALALQFARNIAASGKKVGFFSYETALEDAADRLVSNAAEVLLSASKEKRLSSRDMARVEGEEKKNAALPLTVIESADYTVDQIRTETMAQRFRVIFVDYVQLVPTDYRDAKDAVSYISKSLHRMAQQLGVTVFALSQVTMPEKKADGSRRYISKEDLRESKQLKMDAEAVLLLDMWDTTKLSGDRILIVGKNKDGALGNIRLKFTPRYMRFEYQPPEDKKKSKTKGKEVAGQQALDEDGNIKHASFTDIDDDDDELPF